MKLEKPIIFFDLETTGVDVTTDRIVEIATIKIDIHGNKETKSYIINPTIPIPKEASDVHGITDEDVKDKPTFSQYAKNLHEYFLNCDIGGYNSNSFDLPLLIEEFNRCGIVFDVSDISLVDVMLIEIQANSRKLTEVYKKFTGLDLEDAHSAYADVEATITVLEHQIANYNLEATPESLDTFSQGDSKRIDVAGKLCYVDNEICWTFGKNKHEPIKNDLNYVWWFLRQSCPTETKEIIKKECNI